MEAIVMFLGVFSGLIVLGLLAATVGADSRDKLPDDHRR